jgi:regulator of protease activity HflC (stomatin/prohibitin superfamily)
MNLQMLLNKNKLLNKKPKEQNLS